MCPCEIRKNWRGDGRAQRDRARGSNPAAKPPEHAVLSLDELAARTNLSPSTISRVETGKRTISLGIPLPLASALQVDLDALLDVRNDDDVLIRPANEHLGQAHDVDAEPTDRQR